MAKKNEFFGLISGSIGQSFATTVNKSLDDGLFVNVWEDIQTFQRDVGKNALEEITGLRAILVTDYAFNASDTVSAKEFAFHFMQSMFSAKELYGVHIILYTKDQQLYDALISKYENEPESKYEGTRVLFNPSDYTVTQIKGVINSPFNLLSYSDKKKRDMDKMMEEAREKENRRISNKGFMMLLGKQQALQEQLDMTQRELLIVNRKIIEYATALQNDNLESIVDDLEYDVNEDIKTQFEKLQ